MLANNVIEESKSELSSPMVIVGKKDETIRICVDYRKLNSISEMDAYPMPHIDELIEKVGGAGYISTLDLTCGYGQIPTKNSIFNSLWTLSILGHAIDSRELRQHFSHLLTK